MPDLEDGLDPIDDVPVGDVVVRQDESGYGIFNYRGERILERALATVAEAQRLAADIVSPWQGRVHIDVGST
jgi:hypothetical protein